MFIAMRMWLLGWLASWLAGWLISWNTAAVYHSSARLLYYSHISMECNNHHHLSEFCHQIIYRARYKHTRKYWRSQTAYRHSCSMYGCMDGWLVGWLDGSELRENWRSNRLSAYALSTLLLQLDITSSANDETDSLRVARSINTHTRMHKHIH